MPGDGAVLSFCNIAGRAGRVLMVAGAGMVLMPGIRLGRRRHLSRSLMRRRCARRLHGSGKPLQGQRGNQEPEQECVEGAVHSGEYISPFDMAVLADVSQ